MHALFDKNAAKNKWTISASVLRSFVEYFGTATEQLDMYSENGRAQFTSYTEKIMDGKGPFESPLGQIQSLTCRRNIEAAVADVCSHRHPGF